MSRPKSIYRTYPNVSRVLEEDIIQRRKQLKLSQSDLADQIGVSRNCIQQMECHEHLPKIETLFRLIDALYFTKEENARVWMRVQMGFAMDRKLQELSEENEEGR